MRSYRFSTQHNRCPNRQLSHHATTRVLSSFVAMLFIGSALAQTTPPANSTHSAPPVPNAQVTPVNRPLPPPNGVPQPAGNVQPTSATGKQLPTGQPATKTSQPGGPATPSASNAVPSMIDGKPTAEQAYQRTGEKLYQYRDKNGKIVITNTPPPDVVLRDDPTLYTITGSQSRQGPSTAQDRLKALEEAKKKSDEAKRQETESRAQESLKKLQCQEIKNRTALYESKREIDTPGPDGKPTRVSPEQRQETLETLRGSYDSFCQ